MIPSERRISIQLVDSPEYLPGECWTVEVNGAGIQGSGIIEEFERLVTLDGEERHAESHIITTRETRYEWGASGAMAEYMIAVSANLGGGIGAVAAVSAIKSAINRIKKRSGAQDSYAPIGAEQAQSIIKSHIALHYGVHPDQLAEIHSVFEPNNGVREFTFVSDDGTEYGGTMGELEGSPNCTRVWMKSVPPLRPEFRHLLEQSAPTESPLAGSGQNVFPDQEQPEETRSENDSGADPDQLPRLGG